MWERQSRLKDLRDLKVSWRIDLGIKLQITKVSCYIEIHMDGHWLESLWWLHLMSLCWFSMSEFDTEYLVGNHRSRLLKVLRHNVYSLTYQWFENHLTVGLWTSVDMDCMSFTPQMELVHDMWLVVVFLFILIFFYFSLRQRAFKVLCTILFLSIQMYRSCLICILFQITRNFEPLQTGNIWQS